MTLLVIALDAKGSVVGGRRCISASDADRAEHEIIGGREPVATIIRIPDAFALLTTHVSPPQESAGEAPQAREAPKTGRDSRGVGSALSGPHSASQVGYANTARKEPAR